MLDFLKEIIGGDRPTSDLNLAQWGARAALIYCVGLLLVRLGKHRLLGRSTSLDIILGVVLGSLLSRGINGSATMSSTITACAFLIIVHTVFSVLAFQSDWFGWLIKGTSLPLYENGQLLHQNLRKSAVSHRDLEQEMRLNGNIDTPSQAKSLFLERNGEITVVKKGTEAKVIEIKVEEGVQTIRLSLE